MGASATRRGAGTAALILSALLGLCACGGGDQASGPLATSPPIAGSPPATSPGTATSAPASSTPTGAGGTRTVIAPLGLNLRADHSTASAVLGMLGQGTVVTVVSHTDAAGGGWYQVHGLTRTGWIIDDPRYTSPRLFNSFQSDSRGLSALYPTSWTFAESAAALTFQPQSGPQVISVVTAATLDAIGPPGRQGYTQSDSATVEVFGVTGVLRYYDRSGATAATTAAPGSASAAGETTHLAEIRLTIDATHAMRIDFDYLTPADLPIFVDVYDSVVIYAAAHTPAPSTASPSPGH